MLFKRHLALSALFCFSSVSSFLFADIDPSQTRHLENRITALEQKRPSNGSINPSARPQVRNGYDVFFTADLLLWQAHEDGVPLFIKNKGQGFDADLSHSETKGLHWDWDWGFRIGGGYNLMHDGWDASLTWMRVYGHAAERAHTSSANAFWPSFTHPAGNQDGLDLGTGPYTKSHSHWKLQLNQLDLELGREFFVSKFLTLRPHFGLRSDCIRQKLHIHYNRFEGVPGETYEVELHNRFWGLGLAAGLNTQWSLGSGWSIYADGAFAMLYGFHEIDREDTLSVTSSFDFVDMDSSYRISRAVGDLALGFRWDKMFCRDRFHFGIQGGWEQHVYFGQNQFIRFVDHDALGNFVANQGDLTFQGWTLSARFDF
ncbi:MAG: hypothetical protein HYZ48_04980 [Chlamydiales bacterium]|nr:hypothetical protein [Chlamydiales bacterium]